MSMFISPRGIHRYRATHAALSIPVISSLSGTPRDEDLGAFTMTVTGTGFIPTSVVQWDGSARATTYVSPTSLTAAILSGDVDDAGTFAVTVNNPGAGVSNSSTFTVDAAAAGDPYFANVVSLLHADGHLTTTFTDVIAGKTWTPGASPYNTNAESKFGGTSILYNSAATDGLINSNAHADFAMGAGDWTIELWWRTPAAFPGTLGFLFDFRTGAAGNHPTLYYDNASGLQYYAAGAGRISAGSTLSTSTWYHIAVCKASGSTRIFAAGTQVGSTYTDGIDYNETTPRVRLNGNGNGTGGLGATGYMDDWRVTKGVARYTGSFTPPTTEHPDS